jgi:hypothetical protein
MNVIRSAQAACSSNKGFGVMTILVTVNGKQPVFWNPIMRHKLHPQRAAKVEMTPQVAMSLMAAMDLYTDEKVILPDQD